MSSTTKITKKTKDGKKEKRMGYNNMPKIHTDKKRFGGQVARENARRAAQEKARLETSRKEIFKKPEPEEDERQ